MNWKNVLLLVGVEIKSYRMVRGSKFRRFRESRLVTYGLFVGACLIGALIGWALGSFYHGVSASDLKNLLLQGATYLFISLPTLSLLYGIVFTQMNQIQRIGVKKSIEPLYWFPISWKERTLASILANVLGVPLVISIFIGSSIFVASIFFGLIPLAVLTIFALLASVILASVTTEILKVLQVRTYGAVTRVAGRRAVWVRLLGSILFFIIFYGFYFSFYYSVTPIALIESVAGGQRMLWFLPYVWPGMVLSTFVSKLWVEMAAFSLASLIFIYALFVAATNLNTRFGLYEAPSIRISYGVYVPRAGVLGRLGFSALEEAIMRKDFRAFTRRNELMYIFIFPIISIIVPILSAMRGSTALPSTFSSFLFVYLTLLPGTLMTIVLGTIIVGSEGESIWYLYSSPISAKSLVKAKYSFIILFGLFVTSICSLITSLLTTPSIQVAFIGFFEAVFLIFSLAMVSLTCGIKGADFRELLPRPSMIRPKWGFINMAVCFATGLAIIAPMIPYAMKLIFQAGESWLTMPMSLSEYYPYIALLTSGVIAAVITYIFRKTALNSAEQLLAKAEG